MTIRVRVAAIADAPAVAAVYAQSVRTSPATFEESAPVDAEMARRIAACLPVHPYLVATLDEEVVGYAYAGAHRARSAYRWTVEVSAYVDSEAHSRGIGRALYDVLLAILGWQGFHIVVAGIVPPNLPSERLHESVGFRHVGVFPSLGFKFGAWHDVSWWALTLQAPSDPPREPVPFAEIRGRAGAEGLVDSP